MSGEEKWAKYSAQRSLLRRRELVLSHSANRASETLFDTRSRVRSYRFFVFFMQQAALRETGWQKSDISTLA
jgi:hypothetical protein